MAKWLKLGRYNKILKDVLSGEQDDDINLNELCALLKMLGCRLNHVSEQRQIFSYGDVEEQLELCAGEEDHSKATCDQVKQVREFIQKYIKV